MTGEAEVRAVIEAWTNEGPYPAYHREHQRELRREWPTLAKALDRLTKTETRTRHRKTGPS